MKILVVDDERMMLRIAARMLSKEYEIVCAGSGAEALELFAQEKPDLVLSDLLMPEMDGYEMHRRLQEISASTVPIIFMTADESDESESKGFEAGASDYIRKPLKAEVLLGRVRNVLDKVSKIQGLTVAATLDQMTGLLNKTAAEKELGKVCASSQGVLMLLDLDSFKLVNDLHGHAMGDKVLVKFAELVRGMIRSTDVAGRIGGDEFFVFCRGVRDEKIIFDKTRFLNNHLQISAKKWFGEDMAISLGVSVGAVFVPEEGRDFATLRVKADKALYKVKHQGKHGCAFYGEENSAAQESKNVLQTQMILGERSREAGALFVDFEKFKAVYRFVARQGRHSAKFLDIKLNGVSDEACEEFTDVLIKSLRRSDCVTRYGRNQFLVLLSETEAQDVEFVRQKILSAWRLKGEVTFEAGKV